MLPDTDLSSSQCLDALEANLRTLLLHTGSALSDSANLNATNITQTRDRVYEILPSTLDNFHRALGDLELGLTRARSALHRDVEGLRQRSAQKPASIISKSESESNAAKADADMAMLESQQSAMLSDVFGPPTPPPNNTDTVKVNGNHTDISKAPSASTQPPADDPLAHPKPNGKPFQEHTNGTPENAASLHEKLTTKRDDTGATKQLDSFVPTEVQSKQDAEMSDGHQVTSASVGDPAAPQSNGNTIQQEQTGDRAIASKPPHENNTLLPDLEFYANDDINANTTNDEFILEGFNSSNAMNAGASTDARGQGQNNDFLTDLPDDFLQDDAGDGMSFEEQFDFGAFDFSGGGDDAGDEANGVNGENQTWDSNFFDESLFSLDGGVGD